MPSVTDYIGAVTGAVGMVAGIYSLVRTHKIKSLDLRLGSARPSPMSTGHSLQRAACSRWAIAHGNAYWPHEGWEAPERWWHGARRSRGSD